MAASSNPQPTILLKICFILFPLLLSPCFAQYQAKSSLIAEDPLFEMLPVPAGAFPMGRADEGDDAQYGYDREAPRHSVTLSAYEIGKYPVTNNQYCGVLNYALGKGYLQNSNGTSYTTGTVYHGGMPILGVVPSDPNNPDIVYHTRSMIEFAHDIFVPKWREIPHNEFAYMENHPVVNISWYGCLAFSNWLSEMEGLTPCYNLTTWELIDADSQKAGQQFHNGYRLPTEAEWMRAAGWDGIRNWTYGIMRDTLNYPEDAGRANFTHPLNTSSSLPLNPIGLIEPPFTSPVGWYNGININPNGGVQTIESKSPVGAYDMCGNVREWVYDWSSDTYYGEGPKTNPTGPATGTLKVMHGGSFNTNKEYTRVNNRDGDPPSDCYFHNGMRLARSSQLTAAETWTAYE